MFVPTNDAFTKALSQYGVTPTQALQQTSLIRGVSFASITTENMKPLRCCVKNSLGCT